MDGPVTIYQWAALWSPDEVEERIRGMIFEAHQYFFDSNVLAGLGGAALHKDEANYE